LDTERCGPVAFGEPPRNGAQTRDHACQRRDRSCRWATARRTLPASAEQPVRGPCARGGLLFRFRSRARDCFGFWACSATSLGLSRGSLLLCRLQRGMSARRADGPPGGRPRLPRGRPAAIARHPGGRGAHLLSIRSARARLLPLAGCFFQHPASLAAMRSQVGTSGFSYAEWKGTFYPKGIKAGDMLGHYASRLPTVEINNTFYRLPKPELLEGWRARTPDGFSFAVKATRRITHFKKLRETGELLDAFFANLRLLGPRLGPLLFQLPPTVRL